MIVGLNYANKKKEQRYTHTCVYIEQKKDIYNDYNCSVALHRNLVEIIEENKQVLHMYLDPYMLFVVMVFVEMDQTQH